MGLSISAWRKHTWHFSVRFGGWIVNMFIHHVESLSMSHARLNTLVISITFLYAQKRHILAIKIVYIFFQTSMKDMASLTIEVQACHDGNDFGKLL